MLHTSTNAGSTSEYGEAVVKASSDDVDSQLRTLSLWRKWEREGGEAWNNVKILLRPSNPPPISGGYYLGSSTGFARFTLW